MPRATDSIDVEKRTATRMFPNGKTERVALLPGPKGFAVCQFGGDVETSEVPNLLLEVEKPGPPEKTCLLYTSPSPRD